VAIAARAAAINRIAGGNPSTAAQFNTSKQYRDVIEEGLLNNIDAVAVKEGWDKILPAPILDSVKRQGPLLRRAGQHPQPGLVLVFQAGAAKRPASPASRRTSTNSSPRSTSSRPRAWSRWPSAARAGRKS
jgi:hypothetical protein